jgi:hypothetical protein
MGGGGFGMGGGDHSMVGARASIRSAYGPGWTESIHKSSGEMLAEKGIDPKVALGESEMSHEEKCRCCMAVAAAVAITLFLCTVVFFVVWELT